MKKVLLLVLMVAVALFVSFGCAKSETPQKGSGEKATNGEKAAPETGGEKATPETGGEKTEPETGGSGK